MTDKTGGPYKTKVLVLLPRTDRKITVWICRGKTAEIENISRGLSTAWQTIYEFVHTHTLASSGSASGFLHPPPPELHVYKAITRPHLPEQDTGRYLFIYGDWNFIMSIPDVRYIIARGLTKFITDLTEHGTDILVAIKMEENIELTAHDIIVTQNLDLKHRALTIFGYERFIRETQAVILDIHNENQLLAAEFPTERINFLNVKDSTTGRYYLLRVPPGIRTVKEAVAWTFRMSEEQYKPLVET